MVQPMLRRLSPLLAVAILITQVFSLSSFSRSQSSGGTNVRSRNSRLGAATNSRARDMTFAEAQPVLEGFADELPADLKRLSPAQLGAEWPALVRKRDNETRERLLKGDQDSLVNFLEFGTSFTHQPRITANFIVASEKTGESRDRPESNAALQALVARIEDLMRELAGPPGNERLDYVRQLLRAKGYQWATNSNREALRKYLLQNVELLRDEFASYHHTLEEGRKSGDVSSEFAARSTLFQTRGVSLDTSLMPNFALEEALRELLKLGLLSKGSVRRVAIIGPGLDFADKQEGYDFYPLQTTQPFAVMDSLFRLELSRENELQVTTLDISSRVNQHLALARKLARKLQGYILHLPLDSQKRWQPGALAFWHYFGEKIGSPARPAAPPPALKKLQIRAIRVRPQFVLRVTPAELNVVWQRIDLPSRERYDLVIGTNVFVYYGEFEQALSLTNLESMIRPGGLLLTNNGLPEIPQRKFTQLGHSTTVYSDWPDGDHIVWYQKTAR